MQDVVQVLKLYCGKFCIGESVPPGERAAAPPAAKLDSSDDCTPQAHGSATRHAETITELRSGCNSEVELVSLLEEQLPRYQLRADTLTEFSGYEHADWFISTPCLKDTDLLVDLSPELVEETLNYFVLSGERLSQMTRTYNDSEALTRLLEEKERDLELAAHIGKSLLDEKKELQQRVEELEADLTQCQDTVTQLRHDLSLKASLLQIYSQEDSSDSTTPCEDVGLDELNRKIHQLEQENTELRSESQARISSLETEEKKEMQLITDCIKQLSSAAKESCSLQEELSKRTEASLRQQEEISSLLSHVSELQRVVKELRTEAEELRAQLSMSHTVQEEMARELLELRSRYAEIRDAFQELQEELRRRSRVPSLGATPEQAAVARPWGGESLAQELHRSLAAGDSDSLFKLDRPKRPMYRHRRKHHWSQSEESQESDNNDDSQYSSLSSIGLSPHKELRPRLGDIGRCHTPDSVSSEGSFLSRAGRHYRIPDKLQLVKPLEGSQTLHQWQQLATPGLGGIFQRLEGIRMKGAQEASLSLQMKGLALETLSKEQEVTYPSCNFGSALCVFTSCMSSPKCSTTSVTSSCQGLQLATSVRTRIDTVPSLGSSATSRGLADILRDDDVRVSLPKVVCKRNQAASPTPTPYPSPMSSCPGSPEPRTVSELMHGVKGCLLRAFRAPRDTSARLSSDREKKIERVQCTRSPLQRARTSTAQVLHRST